MVEDTDKKLPEGSTESVQPYEENIWSEEGTGSIFRDGQRTGQREDDRSASPVSLSQEEEDKIAASVGVSLVWCARCDTNLIWVHSSYYCPNCKMKFGCCGE